MPSKYSNYLLVSKFIESAFWVFVLCLFILFIVKSVGYGVDGDMYRMLDTWQKIRAYGDYDPSRFQGNPLAEFTFGFSAEVGGGVLVGILNFIFCLGVLFFGVKTIQHIGNNSILSSYVYIFILVLNPYFLKIYISPIDYSIGLFLFSGAFYSLLCLKSKDLFILLSGLAAGSRIQYAPLSSFILLYYYVYEYDEINYMFIYSFTKKFFTLFIICTLFYIPTFIDGGMTMSNFGAAQPPNDQGILARFARLFYKYFLLLGGFSFLFLIYPIYSSIRYNERLFSSNQKEFILYSSIICIFYDAILFFSVPADPAYLLTSVYFFSLILYSIAISESYIYLYSTACIVSSIYLITPLSIQHKDTGKCGGIVATGAHIELNVATGTVSETFRNYETGAECGSRLLETGSSVPVSPLKIPKSPSSSD
jgi:hypothetical protein